MQNTQNTCKSCNKTHSFLYAKCIEKTAVEMVI
nr:MAG TPA: hypothetical protein [Caudoviricetes sp.]